MNRVLTLLLLSTFCFSLAEAQPKKNPYQRSRLTSDESEIKADKRTLLLSAGEDKAVDLDFPVNPAQANGITIANPTVVGTTLVKMNDKYQMVFRPLKTGDTTVTVRDEEGTLKVIFHLKVSGSNLLTAASELRNLFRDIEGIDVRIVGKKIIVDGEVLVPSDYGRIIAVVSQKGSPYEGLVMNLSQLSPLSLQALSKRIETDIKTFAPNVTTRVVNSKIFLEGTVENKGQADRAERIAALYLPDIQPTTPLERNEQFAKSRTDGGSTTNLVQSFLVINPPPPKKADKLVRVTFHFVELSKDYDKIFGFKWQPGFASDPQVQIGQNAAGAGASSTSFTATINRLFPKLQSAQTAGFARVIKTSTIIVRSGEVGKFREITNYPFKIIAQNGQETFGQAPVELKTSVTPSILGTSDDINMDLNLAINNVVSRGPSAAGPPVIAGHEVETKLYVKSNESAAIGGLTANNVNTNFNKDDPQAGAPAGDNGFLFSLLRSKQYSKKKTQFVIFVTPQIVENASEGSEDLKRNFRVKVN